MSTRRQFLRQSALLAGGLIGAGALSDFSIAASTTLPTAPASRPDVLFIAVEDTSVLYGCYGNTQVKTPNIDAFASRGIVFDHAYCQASVCNPSRASIITGMRPETLGIFGNFNDWRLKTPPDHPILPELFQKNGYETVIGGKITHNERYLKDATAESSQRQKDMWDRTIKHGPAPSITLEPIRPKNPMPEDADAGSKYVQRACNWGPSGRTEDEEGDMLMAVAVAEELARPQDKPRFIAVGLSTPHYDLRAPQKYFDMYPPESITLPPKGEENPALNEYDSFNLTEAKWLTDDEKRQVTAAYYASISLMDAAFGRIMQALKDSGREDNTIVVFWSDHGFHQGHNGLWQKDTLFEVACRVPMLMAGPGIERGRHCPALVELVDMYPTLAEACQFELPERLEGTSLVPLLKDPARPWKKAAFSVRKSARNVSARTERWRYTQWGEGGTQELYDHQSDPQELRNLAGSPEHQAVVEEMRQVIKGGWKQALPS